MCHVSHIIYHTSCVTCHVSHAGCRVSPVTGQRSLTPTAKVTDPPPANYPSIKIRQFFKDQKHTKNVNHHKKNLREKKTMF